MIFWLAATVAAAGAGIAGPFILARFCATAKDVAIVGALE
jgi:hypothetical protein